MNVLLLLVFAGVVLIMANELVATRRRAVRVEYRYLPRDLDTYLREEPLASVAFESMFKDEDVTVSGR